MIVSKSGLKKTQGQAIAEFLTAMTFALVPITLMIVAVGHMLNVQTTANKAARYVAWERIAYDSTDYQIKLDSSGDDFGFASEVNQRFLMYSESGFSPIDVNDPPPLGSRQWRNPENNNDSLVDMVAGAARSEAGSGDVRLVAAEQHLSKTSDALEWISDKADLESNPVPASFLSIPFSKNNSLLSGSDGDAVLSAKAPFVLLADSWMPTNDQSYSERVDSLRSSANTTAHRWYQTIVGGAFSGIFKELDEKLFVGDVYSESFDMVSGEQSTVLPLQMYQE